LGARKGASATSSLALHSTRPWRSTWRATTGCRTSTPDPTIPPFSSQYTCCLRDIQARACGKRAKAALQRRCSGVAAVARGRQRPREHRTKRVGSLDKFAHADRPPWHSNPVTCRRKWTLDRSISTSICRNKTRAFLGMPRPCRARKEAVTILNPQSAALSTLTPSHLSASARQQTHS
jgi:hypothetical protein